MKALFQMRRVRRVRHEVRHREVEVVQVERVSPNFVAVAFAGESLADFVSECLKTLSTIAKSRQNDKSLIAVDGGLTLVS